MDVQTASLSELQAEFVRLAGELALVQNARRNIEQEINRRLAAIRAETRLSAMTLLDREALKAALESETKR